MTESRLKSASEVEYGELPELARGLRALGSSRRSGGERQSHFFFALIDARRRAEQATTAAARIDAFDTAELNRALDRAIERFLGDWPDKRPAARRALRAELSERVIGYSASLAELAEKVRDVRKATGDAQLAAWRAWTGQLIVVFESADRAWMALMAVSDSMPSPIAPTRQ